jgi:hypothetical protein
MIPCSSFGYRYIIEQTIANKQYRIFVSEVMLELNHLMKLMDKYDIRSREPCSEIENDCSGSDEDSME